MAHLRETFPVLEDLASGEGRVLHEALQGTTAAGKSGLIGISFKDASGNLVLPQLTSEGKLPVDFAGAGVPKAASSDGEVAGSLTDTTVAEISLTANKTYGKLLAKGSCFKEAVYYLVQLDDVTETIIGHGLVGAGDYNTVIDLGAQEIVAGATGTQKLILKAKNIGKVSDFMGHVSCLELAV